MFWYVIGIIVAAVVGFVVGYGGKRSQMEYKAMVEAEKAVVKADFAKLAKSEIQRLSRENEVLMRLERKTLREKAIEISLNGFNKSHGGVSLERTLSDAETILEYLRRDDVRVPSQWRPADIIEVMNKGGEP